MKIIASAGTSKWIAEIDSYELRELDSEVKLEIGAKFEIRKAAETLQNLRSLNRNKLDYIGRYINDLQAKFSEIEEAYDALMMLDTIKHSEDK
jgi:hypothetical protein